MNKRAAYTKTSEEQENRIQAIREGFSALYDLIEKETKPGRETSLALTNLEQAQFWAIKGVSRENTNE